MPYWPSYQTFIDQALSYGIEDPAVASFSLASNVVVGTNPAYSATDLFSFFPKFGGSPLLLTGVITAGMPAVTGLDTTAGILPGQAVSPVVPLGGQLLAGSFPNNCSVVSVDSNTQITVSLPALTNGAQIAIYTAPFVPMAVVNAYIALASASLVKNRWQDMWLIGMANYIAHFCTLYLRSDGDIYSTPGQAATSGLARGITVSKAAGGVSMGIQPSTAGSGLESWGAFTETTYGVQFATIARIVGMGPMLIY